MTALMMKTMVKLKETPRRIEIFTASRLQVTVLYPTDRIDYEVP